jgi:hypothetical protein
VTAPQGDEPDDAGGPADDDGGTDPLDVAPDDMFAAAVGARVDEDGGTDPLDVDERGAPTDVPIADEAAPGVSVYPDGPPAPLSTPPATTAPVWGTPRLPPPGGRGFARRAPRTGPEPDEHGYYPDDYYVPPDWTRLFARLVVAAVLVATLAVAGLEIADRVESSDDETRVEPTPTPATEVAVYECAGDPDPVALLPPPGTLLIAGRTADSRWLAFRNLEPPPLQLWVEARDVPTFVPSTVGIVSCATAPDEFPTPR